MCGFVGIISPFLMGYEYRTAILAMNNSIKHRGPDDEGYLTIHSRVTKSFCGDDSIISDVPHISNFDSETFNSIWGFRRLSIIDLTQRGHQPMSYLNRYWIVFNGEIYNYIELREELKHYGYKFTTESDTEVILAAYDKWLINCFSRFNGMWAMVIYDSVKEEFLISRDRYGIKPLYIYESRNHLVFASEIKSILQLPNISTNVNSTIIESFLRNGNKEYLRETSFTNIYRFPKASFQYIKIDNLELLKSDEKIFYRPILSAKDENFNSIKETELSEKLLFLITDSIKLRMRSDVKIGSAFSGGIDSSTVVKLMNDILNTSGLKSNQYTFSTVFTQKETKHCDESYYIDILTKQLNIHSYKIEPTYKDVQNEYFKMVYFNDTPAQSSLMSYYFTYKLAGDNNIKVSLDGQGADELLGGYILHLINFMSNNGLLRSLREGVKFRDISGAKRVIILGILFSMIKNLKLRQPVLELLKARGIYNNPFTRFNDRIYQDFDTHIMNFFHYGDRASMAHSVEARFPFMDYRLVDFIWSVPESYKIHNGWTKYLLRKSMQSKLPIEITERRNKLGWEIPESYWFRNQLHPWVSEIINESNILKDLNVKETALKKLNGNGRIVDFIRYFNLAIWYNCFFKTN